MTIHIIHHSLTNHSVLHINIHTMKHTVSDLFSNDMTFKFISTL